MSPSALVLGGADCVWDDVAASEAILGSAWWDVVVACNQAGAAWPDRLDHWATLHPEKLHRWLEARSHAGHPGGFLVWSHERRPRRGHPGEGRGFVDRTLPVPKRSGSSGLFAVDVAREVGATRIVLCGVPMTASPHFDREAPWAEADRYWPRWVERLDDLGPLVRSMSGRTRELLGAPDSAWMGPC